MENKATQKQTSGSAALPRGAYFSEDTIAAIVTGLGGAISVVRVSGPKAFDILHALTGSSATSKAEPRRLYRTLLKDPAGNALDDVLFVRFVAPESYTGEDVVEFHLHGSAYIALRLMEVLAEAGARQAFPGEFSFRAVRNGKLSLSQAQAVADLISATNDGAVSLALEKLGGTQNKLIGEIAESLRQLAMLAEAGIDFSDQDLEDHDLSSLQTRLETVIEGLQKLEAGYQRGVRLQDGIGVAFVGLPNAGKSSFFNALLGEDRSIVSEQAGTTRDIVREHITLRGRHGTVTLRLEDTAGLRQVEDAAPSATIEKEGIERTRRAARDADLLLLVVDSAALEKEPAHLGAVHDEWAALGSPAEKTIGILTKMDLYSRETGPEPASEAAQRLAPVRWLQTSAKSGSGIHEAVQAITDFCEKWTHRRSGEVLLTRIDQREAVTAALVHLNRARLAPELALFAADLRQALNALALLIGDTLPDDILGRIFSQFCIGK